VVVVVANAGAAATAADSRNARLARDKSMLVTSKDKVPGRGANSTGTSIECANKKGLAPEECGHLPKRKFDD
jgi:hypothetical protein